MKPEFLHLNVGWNAEPNAPEPHVEVQRLDIMLRFYMNPFKFKEFKEDELGYLRFVNCARYRLGPANDEGWYRGQCRFSQTAPEWGEFYELSDDPKSAEGPTDWHVVNAKNSQANFTIFCFISESTPRPPQTPAASS